MKLVARVHAMPPEHNAGAEHMLVSMLRPLVERGHDVEVWLSRYSQAHEVYEYHGVRVVPLEARLDFAAAARHAHVILSHLECVPSTAALARGYGKPMAVICHNTHRVTFRNLCAGQTALAVYNSLWMEREAELYLADYPKAIRPGRALVVRPPVFASEYATRPGDKVTLINCAPEKGGRVLRDLARRMPDTAFLAVRGGYGEQVDYAGLDNVEVVPHVDGRDMATAVFGRTRVLLMPSAYESWGRAGVEAMASGIPVVAHPTPGLCESLGEAGTFADRNDVDAWVAVLRKLEATGEWRLASKRARARSGELDPTAELDCWCDAVESLA